MTVFSINFGSRVQPAPPPTSRLLFNCDPSGCGPCMHDVVMFVEDVCTIPTHVNNNNKDDLRPDQLQSID